MTRRYDWTGAALVLLPHVLFWIIVALCMALALAAVR